MKFTVSIHAIIIKTKVLLFQAKVFNIRRFWQSYLGPLVFLPPKTFKLFGLERTRWRLSQKRVVRIKFDIYVFILMYHINLLDAGRSATSIW